VRVTVMAPSGASSPGSKVAATVEGDGVGSGIAVIVTVGFAVMVGLGGAGLAVGAMVGVAAGGGVAGAVLAYAANKRQAGATSGMCSRFIEEGCAPRAATRAVHMSSNCHRHLIHDGPSLRTLVADRLTRVSVTESDPE
jgi:hypothetical protein